MAISINPVDLFRIFRDRGIADRSAMADYLNVIATLATALTENWMEIYAGMTELEGPDYRFPHWRGFAAANQYGIFHELSEHYARASTVLNGKLNEAQMEELFEALGTLLSTRNETRGF